MGKFPVQSRVLRVRVSLGFWGPGGPCGRGHLCTETHREAFISLKMCVHSFSVAVSKYPRLGT